LPEVMYCSDPYGVAEESEAPVVCIELDEFKNLDFKRLKFFMNRPFVLDGRNIFDQG